jgi:hypothetical protein
MFALCSNPDIIQNYLAGITPTILLMVDCRPVVDAKVLRWKDFVMSSIERTNAASLDVSQQTVQLHQQVKSPTPMLVKHYDHRRRHR